MKTMLTISAALPLLLLAQPRLAGAEPMPETVTAKRPLEGYAFGMRVGGYGFRNVRADKASDKWNDCRMNGVGVFGQRDLTQHAFVEAGTDVYFSDNFILGADQATHTNMDRLSGLLSASAGLRMFPTSRISGFAQIGLGMELTRVTLAPQAGTADGHDGQSMEQVANDVMPLGFIGFGGDVKLGSRTRVGANFRTYLMAHYEHGPEVNEPEVEPEAANQVQFYLRYSL